MSSSLSLTWPAVMVVLACVPSAVFLAATSGAWAAPAPQVLVVRQTGPGALTFGAERLAEALRAAGWAPKDGPTLADTWQGKSRGQMRIVLAMTDRPDVISALAAEAGAVLPQLGPESYVLRRTGTAEAPSVWIIGADPAGAMYGALDLAEQLRLGTALNKIADKAAQPRFAFRAIKFNLPWMSYRKHEALSLHEETCRDLAFWERFLDMMAQNRFNVLSLWNLHPFPWMIRPRNFPEACPLSDAELAEWQRFWKKLFRMAKDRGIETYIIDWNIFVSPALAQKHGVAKYSIDWSYFGDADTSELVQRYNRECVTQVIDEYEDLAGLGVGLGERMGGMTPVEREQWIVDTVVAGMKAAKRPAKFIHRAPFSAGLGSGGSTDAATESIARRIIEGLDLPQPIWVEAKFNWSHGHSSPKLHIIHGGKSTDAYWNPLPRNYRMVWTVRNEDFFTLRWGQPQFIRDFIAHNGQPYVGGCFIGSECYIPAKDYFSFEEAGVGWPPGAPRNWKYAFERQWLFYMLWGRLLYDPTTPDAVFAAAFDRRYGKGVGEKLLPAFALASAMPLRLASFHKSTWDFTLYSEGFIAAGRGRDDAPFISIDDLIKTPVLDPVYLSIPEYVKLLKDKQTPPAERITPAALAQALERDGKQALALVEGLGVPPAGPVFYEVQDVKAWSRLSLYFADKLRAGVALESFRQGVDAEGQKRAVELLERAAGQWETLVAVTRPIYRDTPVVHLGERKFSWESLRGQVRRDIDLAKAAR